MNQNKFNGEGSNNANFAKKATLATITAMAALTLAACGNNNANVKPAGSSEPKTEQSSKSDTSSSSDNSANTSASGIDGNDENNTLNQFINNVKNAGFEIIPGTESTDGATYGVDVKVDGVQGHVGAAGGTYSIDFQSSLGKQGTSNNINEAFAAVKKMIADK
jgi:hypothetical protein